MSENTQEGLKAAAIFTMGLHQNPIVEISRLSNSKVGGVFMPTIETKVAVAAGTVSSVQFPILTCDLMSVEDLETFRQNLHKRIDKTIDNYKERWEAAMKKKQPSAENPKEENDASVSKPEAEGN